MSKYQFTRQHKIITNGNLILIKEVMWVSDTPPRTSALYGCLIIEKKGHLTNSERAVTEMQ
jgi:hypothetical protein